jgi:glycerophosphoryl diester phosphodiesterase
VLSFLFISLLVCGNCISQTLVIAHRGASAYEPENTLAAFEKAIEMKADYIETDVHQTKDSVLVLMHDMSFDRTCEFRTTRQIDVQLN